MDGLLCALFFAYGVKLVTSSVTNLVTNYSAGFFTSNNYPNGYFDSTSDYWYLTAENASDVIGIKFYNIGIESSSNCAYDFVKVYDGPSTSSNLLGKFCDHAQTCYVSTGSALTVYFSTDSTVNDIGFKATYWSTQPGEDDCKAKEKWDVGAIVGIAVGSIAVFIILWVIIIMVIKSNNKKQITPGRRFMNTRIPVPPPYSLVNPAFQTYIPPRHNTGYGGKIQTVQSTIQPGQPFAQTNFGALGGVSPSAPPINNYSTGASDNEPPDYETLTPPPAHYLNPQRHNFG